MIDILLTGTFEAAIRITVVAVLVGLALRVLRVRDSRARHATWTAVLAAMLLMPLLPALVPALPVDLPATPAALERFSGEPRPLFVEPPAPPLGCRAGHRHYRQPHGSARACAGTSLPASAVSLASGRRRHLRARRHRHAPAHRRGLRRLSRLARASRPVPEHLVSSRKVFESPTVAAPVTIGLLSPRVILPEEWKEWPGHTLAAVLAHEHAHRIRRDPLITLLAHLNRALFWFHPVAWWLERTLARTAEHACDDAALTAGGTRRGYVEVLLQMAEAVRLHGGRLAYQGVGVNGGRLGERIDRIMRGDTAQPASRRRKAVLAASCAIVVALVASCRQQADTAAPLQEDPALAAELNTRQERSEFYTAAQKMTPAEAAALEETLSRNPEDMAAREKLLVFYRWTGKNTQDWNDNVAARRRHALWLVEHHPDSDLVNLARISKLADPMGYEQVRTLWHAHVARPDASIKVLDHAAWFFTESEKPVAEELLLRARSLQPDGPQPRVANGVAYLPWSTRLGELYARVLVGSIEESLGNVVKNTSAAAANSAYARQIRQKLDATTDVAILGSAGRYLMFNARNATVPFDHIALGRTYLERAAKLDPQSASARLLEDLARQDRESPLLNPFPGAPRESWPDLLAKLPEEERFPHLARLAEREYLRGENQNHLGRKSEALDAFAQSERYAREALALAPRFANHPAYPDIVFRSHLAVGLHALGSGDRRTAADHLLEAGKVTPTRAPLHSLEYRLVNYLLKDGERDAVVAYLERAAAGRDEDARASMMKAADAIRSGRMPEHYQRLLASGSL